TLLADSLVAMKLLSDSSGADAAGLAVVAQGYDAIRRAAAGQDPVHLRVLSIGDFPTVGDGSNPTGGIQPPPPPPPVDTSTASRRLAEINTAIASLGALLASSFEMGTPVIPGEARHPASGAAAHSPTGMGGGQGAGPWLMSRDAIAKLPGE